MKKSQEILETAQQGIVPLTSRNALAIKRYAILGWRLAIALAALATALLLGFGIFKGMTWLPAVPLSMLAAIALDALILFIGKAVYHMMIGQALCTESALMIIRREQQAAYHRAVTREETERLRREAAERAQARPKMPKRLYTERDERPAEEAPQAADERPRERRGGLHLVDNPNDRRE